MSLVETPAVITLDLVSPTDAAPTGGKAYNCASLKQAGFPVPDGLVVLAAAKEADLSDLARHRWFDRFPADARFAVRSSGIGEDSAGQSFAGIHETLLNVRREQVFEAVQACRASAWSPQALEYRRARGLNVEGIQIAVLVQQMVRAVAAGVAFTVNPLTGAQDEMVVNSSWGLGEALVGGRIEPDEFGLRKADAEVLWQRIGEKGEGTAAHPSLSVERLRELGGLLAAVERHYGAPQDVEWCLDDRQFWIVQSRPVTTSRPAAAETEWTRANLAEVFPDLMSPQAVAAFDDMLNGAERRYMGPLMAPEETLGPMIRPFGGRLYFNLSQLKHVCRSGGIAPAELMRSLGHAGTIQLEDEKAVRPPIGAILRVLPALVRLVWLHARVAHIVRWHEKHTQEYLDRLSGVAWEAKSDQEMWSIIEQWVGEAPKHMQPVLLLGGVLFHETPLRKICEKVGFPFERLVYPQLAAGKRSVSAQQAYDLVALADRARRDPQAVRCLTTEGIDLAAIRQSLRGSEFLEEFERFLARYGHRGRYESDWALPRYYEDPRDLLVSLRAHLQHDGEPDRSSRSDRQTREAAEALAEFAAKLSVWQRWTLLPRVERSIRTIKQYYLWREQVRSDLVRVLAELRKCHITLASRFVQRGWLTTVDQYFLLHLDEVAGAIAGGSDPRALQEIANRRAAEQERYRAIRMPLLMRESELTRLIRSAGMSGGPGDEGELTGQPVSAGRVEAEVVVVNGPGDFARMKRGAILVAEATDPSWTPLFTLASGVIVEVGGILSHASTIAREYGLPALANVRRATKRLKTGEVVELDAVDGVIRRRKGAE